MTRNLPRHDVAEHEQPSLPSESASSRPESVRAVSRALDVLNILSTLGGEASLVELASISRLPASSVHRLLHTCISYGYIRQTRTHRYALGPQLLALRDPAARQVGHIAQPRLRELV